MIKIKLEPGKLLGFKIIANGEDVTTLHSPKIGAKDCVVTNTDAMPASARVATKI